MIARVTWILIAPLFVVGSALLAYADDQAAKAGSPATPSIVSFDTVEGIKTMSAVKATLRSRTPCSAELTTADGAKIHLGSPNAPAEIVSFLSTLKEGEAYDLPDAFIGYQALQPLEEKLTPVVLKYFPDAQFSRTTTQFESKHGTMEFLVHGRSKTGEITSTAHKEEGPNFRGFLLRLQVLPERFQMAAVVPQEITQPYWTTFLDMAPLPDKKSYLLISFSYGGRLAPEFRQAIRAALPSSLSPPQ